MRSGFRRRDHAARSPGVRRPLRRYVGLGVVRGRRRGRTQRDHQLVRRRPVGRVLREAAPEQRYEILRHTCQVRFVVHHLVRHDVRAVRVEGPAPGGRVHQYRAHREHIGGRSHLARTLELLGRHERRCTDQLARLRTQITVRGTGDTEVDDLGPVGRQQHIARLEIAVHHAGAVDVAQRLGQPRAGPAQLRRIQRSVPLHALRERRALDEQRGHPGPFGLGVGIDDGRGEGPADPAGRRDLLLEAGSELRIRGMLGMDDLDRQAQPRGGGGQMDDPHAACAQACLKPVLPGIFRMLRFRKLPGGAQRWHFPPPCGSCASATHGA